jgi:hypothetical protein
MGITIMKHLTLFLLFLFPVFVLAGQSETVTRSAGKLTNDDSISLQQKLAQSPLIRQTTETTQRRQSRTANHDGVNFWIFDAWVELSGDDDDDGYYHHIKTSFDADVDTSLETVYAKLFLSYRGGPWVQFADTELFEIHYDSMSDSYEVETELLEGFETGDYDVLIELHSLYHAGVVASVVLYQDADGYAISLEDFEHDDTYSNEFIVSTSYTSTGGDYLVVEEEYYAGSLSWLGMLFLTGLLIVKWRYFPGRKTAI